MLTLIGVRKVPIISVGSVGGELSLFQQAVALSPLVLFDTSQSSGVWEDTARTTLASVDGVVGSIDDWSGNSNHAIAPSDAARALYKVSGGRSYLLADDVDDGYEFGPVSNIEYFACSLRIPATASNLMTIASRAHLNYDNSIRRNGLTNEIRAIDGTSDTYDFVNNDGDTYIDGTSGYTFTYDQDFNLEVTAGSLSEKILGAFWLPEYEFRQGAGHMYKMIILDYVPTADQRATIIRPWLSL